MHRLRRDEEPEFEIGFQILTQKVQDCLSNSKDDCKVLGFGIRFLRSSFTIHCRRSDD